MSQESYVFATAGHVDHGKSALVKALTGTDPDRLQEEKLRGLTIDLGFAHLILADPADPKRHIDAGIVDVPGHEDFVKNMVAGVGAADAVLLVIAADDGWMPQTDEHVQILSYLGIKKAVVALSKIDLVDDDSEAIALVREYLKESQFADAPIVPVSVVTDRGLGALKSALFDTLMKTATAKDLGKPRLFVDRAFVLQGIGTVVTGTLTGGSLTRGQQVVVQPRGQKTRIRSIESHNRSIQFSGPGNRTALNLQNVDVRSVRYPDGIGRGDVIVAGSPAEPCSIINAHLQRNAVGTNEQAATLKNGARVRLHHGSTNLPARVYLSDTKRLLTGKHCHAQLRLESPLCALAGDRFIIRDWPQRSTIAGGVILEVNASRAGFRTESEKNFLTIRSNSIGDAESWLQAQVSRDKVVTRANALLDTCFSVPEIERAIDTISQKTDIRLFDGLIVDHDWWQALLDQAMRRIDQEHAEHPQSKGLALTDLRETIPQANRSSQLSNLLVMQLCENGFTRQGSILMRTSHQQSLPPHLERVSETLRTRLRLKPLEPPSRDELAGNKLAEEALRFLIQTGEVVEVDKKLVMSVEAFSEAKESITAFLTRHGSASTGEIRNELGTSRRIAIPLLEMLDRDGTTRREGLLRMLQSHSPEN